MLFAGGERGPGEEREVSSSETSSGTLARIKESNKTYCEVPYEALVFFLKKTAKSKWVKNKIQLEWTAFSFVFDVLFLHSIKVKENCNAYRIIRCFMQNFLIWRIASLFIIYCQKQNTSLCLDPEGSDPVVSLLEVWFISTVLTISIE